MAEEQNAPVTEPQVTNPEPASTQTGEKMVSVAEMQRRLKQAEEKHAQSTEQAIHEALEKYKAESELTGKELEEYRKKEAEAEKQKMQAEIDKLKQDKIKRELTDEAIKSLSGRKLPVNDKVLSFVVKDTAESTLEAIADFESIIGEIKAEYAQSEPPKMSSSFSGEKSQTPTDIFRGARII